MFADPSRCTCLGLFCRHSFKLDCVEANHILVQDEHLLPLGVIVGADLTRSVAASCDDDG